MGEYQYSYLLKSNLASVKSDVDEQNFDHSNTIPTGLSKLNNVADNDVVKKRMYGEVVEKVNTNDSERQNLEKKNQHVNKIIPDTTK